MTRPAILVCVGLLMAATACSRQSPGTADDAGAAPSRQAAADSQRDGAPDPSLSQAAGEAQQAAADALRTRPEAPAERDPR